MSQKRELAKNTLILAIGKLSTQFVAFLLVPLYTFFLSPAEYGVVDLTIAYIALLAPMLTIQLEMAAFRFLVDARADDDRKTQIISNIMHVVFAAVALLVALFVILSLFVTIPYGLLVLPIIAITILLNMFMQIARGLGKNKDFAFASVVIAVSNVAAVLGLVVFAKLGVYGIFGSMLLANTVGAIYLFMKLSLYKHITFRAQDMSLKKEFIRYSLPLVPNGISWWVISLFDRTIIAAFLGVAANGIYAVSSKYATIFTSIFAIFGMSWTESASVHINSKDRQIFFSDVFNTAVRAFGSLGLVLIAVLPLVFGIIDPQYAAAYLYVPLLIIGAFFNAMVGLYSAIYVARKMTKQVMTTSLIAAAINIAINFLLINVIGLYAAALATVIGYLAMTIYRHFDIKAFIHISYQKRMVVLLGLLYVIVIYLYYVNVPLINYVNVLVALVSAAILNRHILVTILHKLKHRG